jgi:hypothetical protein
MHFLSIFHKQQNTFGSNRQRWFGKKSLGLLTAFALCLGGACSAGAQDGKTFPGALCQASGSSQSLYYSNSAIANRTAATRSAVCPIVRDNVTQPWQRLAVRVRDRHDTQNITCVAYSKNLDGTTVWSQNRNTVGEGFQTLTFNVPAESDWGAYTLLCQLPPMQNNLPSYISTYFIQEP